MNIYEFKIRTTQAKWDDLCIIWTEKMDAETAQEQAAAFLEFKSAIEIRHNISNSHDYIYTKS